MALFLGIDGGGTKTTCLLADEHRILGKGTAGGSNIVRLGEAMARVGLHAAIRDACAATRTDPAQIQRTCIGAAGGARPEIAAQLRRLLAEVVGGEIEVVGDNVIALEAAFGGGPGVIVIAGTGSIAYGKNAAGDVARAGGWGFAISDEGSGHWIGRTAVAAALRAQDADDLGVLLARLMKCLNVASLEGLIPVANAVPPPDFSALVPVVLSAASAGDAIASGVLTSAGHELAGLAKAVLRRLFPNSRTVPVAMSGGVFANSAHVREVFYNDLHAEIPGIALRSQVIDPADGALALARKATA